MGKDRKAEKHCQFCQILSRSEANTQDSTVLYRDDELFAFHDIDKSTAREHLLVCTIDHIETALDVNNRNILFRMKKVGQHLLDGLCKQGMGAYRFGFHLRPYNSIEHVHLHCFLLPFSSFMKDQIVYGKMLTSVEEAANRLPDPKL